MKKPFKNNYNTSSKPLLKNDNKRLAAIILCCLMAFWTIASVLGIIGFARSFAKEKTISASAMSNGQVSAGQLHCGMIPSGTTFELTSGTLPSGFFNDSPVGFINISKSNMLRQVDINVTCTMNQITYANNPSYLYLFTGDGVSFQVLQDFYFFTFSEDAVYLGSYNLTLSFYPFSNLSFLAANVSIEPYPYILDIVAEAERVSYSSGYNSGYAVGYTEGEQVGRNNGRQDGYDEGYAVGYTEGEQVGREDGREDGYEIGYDEGYFVGVQTGTQQGYGDGFRAGELKGQNDAHEYTFERLIGAVVDVPIQSFLSLFSFDLLGIDLSAFFLSLLTVCAILAVVRFIL